MRSELGSVEYDPWQKIVICIGWSLPLSPFSVCVFEHFSLLIAVSCYNRCILTCSVFILFSVLYIFVLDSLDLQFFVVHFCPALISSAFYSCLLRMYFVVQCNQCNFKQLSPLKLAVVHFMAKAISFTEHRILLPHSAPFRFFSVFSFFQLLYLSLKFSLFHIISEFLLKLPLNFMCFFFLFQYSFAINVAHIINKISIFILRIEYSFFWLKINRWNNRSRNVLQLIFYYFGRWTQESDSRNIKSEIPILVEPFLFSSFFWLRQHTEPMLNKCSTETLAKVYKMITLTRNKWKWIIFLILMHICWCCWFSSFYIIFLCAANKIYACILNACSFFQFITIFSLFSALRIQVMKPRHLLYNFTDYVCRMLAWVN